MKNIINLISKREWRFIALFSLLFIFITLIPLIFGLVFAPAGKTLTGVYFNIPADLPVYYSHLEQVRQGNLLFDNLFSNDGQKPVFNIFWLTGGWLVRFLPFSNLINFNILRVLLIPVLILVSYFFISYFLSEVKWRQLSLVLLFFSSGLGFLLLDRFVRFPSNFENNYFNWPMDLWVPELTIFSSSYHSPHFIASWILILLIFFFTLLFSQTYQWCYSFFGGVSALLLFSFHPFHIITIFSVIAVYFLILVLLFKKNIWRLLSYYLILLLLSSPAVFYYLYLIATDWVINVKNQQNLCLTTPSWLTFFSLGLVLPLASLGIYFLIKHKKIDEKKSFLIIWLVVQFILIYLPISYQRRLIEGIQFPLVMLAVICFIYLWQNDKIKRIFSKFSVLIILFSFLFLAGSNLTIIVLDLYIFQDQRFLSYLDNQQVKAMEWFKDNTNKQSVILAQEIVANLIPAYSGRRVYIGHGVETPFYRQKKQEVSWFFKDNGQDQKKYNWLVKRSIDYIFYSDWEKKLGDFNPSQKTYLKAVYSDQLVTIYQVLPR